MTLEEKSSKLKKIIWNNIDNDYDRYGLWEDLVNNEKRIDHMLDFLADHPEANRDEIVHEYFIMRGLYKVKMVIDNEDGTMTEYSHENGEPGGRVITRIIQKDKIQ